MRGKGNQNQEEEEYEEDEFGSRKDGPSSNFTINNNTSCKGMFFFTLDCTLLDPAQLSFCIPFLQGCHSLCSFTPFSMVFIFFCILMIWDLYSEADGKNSDKANAIRSKHSVTEQKRRSKINERFQMLRDIIPHSDQKRDTASFLLEVIEYVQYLQEKVQKYEGPYPGWSLEPAKLMPWVKALISICAIVFKQRNSHWHLQSFAGHPQATKNGSDPGVVFPGKFDENKISLTPVMLPNAPNLIESDHVTCKVLEHQPELANKIAHLPMPVPVQSDELAAPPIEQPVSDAQSAECPITSEMLNQQELAIEAGTISISGVYSQELLNTLTQALQSAGVDLSLANISVQIDLGKRANKGLTSGTLTSKDPQNPQPCNQARTHPGDASEGEDSDQAQKRLKT
ncbi:hypothetical protein SADUNF_Sadunf10G0103800 [Salix dunnii]|uniref:BHLH domain-containing protein n=1 Tax=Salix dunnii TaxID=1413687 RepID=A0A835MRU2_9ROSI|nr:hypothetical protein SADUNF_Sadunf10G0103800 [Salix dunnii]